MAQTPKVRSSCGHAEKRARAHSITIQISVNTCRRMICRRHLPRGAARHSLEAMLHPPIFMTAHSTTPTDISISIHAFCLTGLSVQPVIHTRLADESKFVSIVAKFAIGPTKLPHESQPLMIERPSSTAQNRCALGNSHAGRVVAAQATPATLVAERNAGCISPFGRGGPRNLMQVERRLDPERRFDCPSSGRQVGTPEQMGSFCDTPSGRIGSANFDVHNVNPGRTFLPARFPL